MVQDVDKEPIVDGADASRPEAKAEDITENRDAPRCHKTSHFHPQTEET